MFATLLRFGVLVMVVAHQVRKSVPEGSELQALKTLVCELLRDHPVYRSVGLNRESQCQFFVVPFGGKKLCIWVENKYNESLLFMLTNTRLKLLI